MKQTGLLYKYDPKDYRVGASPLTPTIVNLLADWRDWRPSDEKQYKDYTFDTMSCATFSALNIVENTINYFIYKGDMINVSQLEWLNKNGFIKDGKLNLSDRFTAIMSGTTPQGNYMQNVWDSIRKDGCIPEAMLPFGGNNWAEYHNKNVITQAMKDLAKQFLEIVDSSYEWTSNIRADMLQALKECPLQLAINNATHAVELIEIDHIFNTYPPFLENLTSPVAYALKGIVKIKVRTLKIGMFGADVERLQTDLKTLGYAVGTIDGKFGKITLAAVKAFQSANGLVSDGIVGKLTFAKIAEVLKKNSSFGLLPVVQRKADAFIAQCKSQGFNIRITEGFRTKERQAELYAQGRTTAGKVVTNVLYPKSLHCHGMAFDVCFTGTDPYPTDNFKWKAIADMAVKLGLTAGYYFTNVQDRPHFEYKDGYLYQDVYDFKYNKADFA